jgi:hypothetical protein
MYLTCYVTVKVHTTEMAGRQERNHGPFGMARLSFLG